MRIALFTDGIFPYVIGGMQKHSFYLAKYLAARGVEVDLYHTNKSAKDISLLELFEPGEKRFIHSIVVPFPDLSRLPGHYLKASFLYSRSLTEEFAKRPKVDFVYTKGFTGWYLLQQRSCGNLKFTA